MRNPLVLLALLAAFSGCSGWRGAPSVAVAPDPVIYPAPAEDQRYLPWVGIVNVPGLR